MRLPLEDDPMNSRPPMNKTDATPPEQSRPDRGEHAALFGPPPLFDEEDTKVYDQLLTQVFTTVTPADIFEHIWVREWLISVSRYYGYAGSR